MTGPNVSCGEKTKITQRVKITIMNQTWSITCTSDLCLVICLMNVELDQLYSVEESSPIYSHEKVKECSINNAKRKIISLNLTAKICIISFSMQLVWSGFFIIVKLK